jgi:hypothetical protein
VCCEACGYCAHEGCVGNAVYNCKPVSLHIPAPLRPDEKKSNPDTKDTTSTSSSTSSATSPSSSLLSSRTVATETSAEIKRALSVEDDDGFAFNHQWVAGNHSTVGDECIVCSLSVGSLFALSGRHCVWCQVTCIISLIMMLTNDMMNRQKFMMDVWIEYQ